MQTALRKWIIGVVGTDEDVRNTLVILLTVELGIAARAAPSASELYERLDRGERLLVLVGERSTLTEPPESVLLGAIDVGERPVDAARVVAQIRARLASVGQD